ncbi:MAG TPA: RluA family pseudouridine synthase [Spirochaetota bacterium]|nr:RluA family pseudouridine synthase [Spirochaetota bacterium]HPJ34026.1 RluA family pseudouridine synthase [Spirochaetota bacterium]
MTESHPDNTQTADRYILYEDSDIIAVNKPAGMLAQKDSTGRQSLISIVSDYLKGEEHDSVPPYCAALHRLDRPVSGIMLFAKTPMAAGRLSDDIRYRKIKKFYCAITDSVPETGSADHWTELRQYMVRRRDRGYIVSAEEPGASEVSLNYRLFPQETGSPLLLVELITGKRHQIRVQLSSLCSPVYGDRFYGSSIKNDDAIFLHAHCLSFTHPSTGLQVNISAPLPFYMEERLSSIPVPDDYLNCSIL